MSLMSAFENWISSNPKRAKAFLNKIPPSFLEKKGKKKALEVFRKAVAKVPAYRKFLTEHGVNPLKIQTYRDFLELPIMDKKNYIDRFTISELCLGGRISRMYSLEKSSGLADKPYYWPRFPGQDNLIPRYLEYLLVNTFNIDKKSTLFLITFALGCWVAGTKASRTFAAVANSGKYELTIMTPGPRPEEILQAIKDVGHLYQQIILIGYPPFIKNLIEKGEKEGLDWLKYHISLILSGEGFTESYRDYVAGKLGINLESKDKLRIVSIYGSADVGSGGGNETALSILVRRLCRNDSKLADSLFGTHSVLPTLVQYSPSETLLEAVDEELVFTSLGGIPLIRYNIHDHGGKIPFNRVVSITKEHGYNVVKLLKDEGWGEEDILPLAFSYVFGRTDGTVTISGANVYVHNIKEALDSRVLALMNTGNFRMQTIYDEQHNPQLAIQVELKEGVEKSSKLKTLYEKEILSALLKVNTEFKSAYEIHSDRKILRVELFRKSDEFSPFASQSYESKYKYVQ